MANVSEMKGMVFEKVEEDGKSVLFTCADGSGFRLYHEQDCCESVTLEDVIGDLQDLVGVPLLLAEEVDSSDEPAPAHAINYGGPESYTWTFYKFGTIKGYVTLRFYGESNGYYSERVDCETFGNPKAPVPPVVPLTPPEKPVVGPAVLADAPLVIKQDDTSYVLDLIEQMTKQIRSVSYSLDTLKKALENKN